MIRSSSPCPTNAPPGLRRQLLVPVCSPLSLNRQIETWDLERVDSELHRHMYSAAQRVKLAAQRYSTDLGTAAYVAALEHLGKVYRLRGIFP